MDLKYKIRNWSQYNTALVNRGSITLWFTPEVIAKWRHVGHTGEKGRPREYSDDAILCILLIRMSYKLPLRMGVGFLKSIVQLLNLDLKIPSYTQVCRRAKSLGKALKRLSRRRPAHIVFDSTGLKVYGEGEWKVRVHGKSKRRTWRKLHIGIDPISQEIIVAELTSNATGSGDALVARKMIKKVPKGIRSVRGDGAYDDLAFRRDISALGAEIIVPPPRDAVVHPSRDPAILNRNRTILEIQGLGGDDQARKLWKKLKGYHVRSLVETAMYRFKQINGSQMYSREFSRQKTEAYIKCMILNKFTTLGMPIGEWVAA